MTITTHDFQRVQRQHAAFARVHDVQLWMPLSALASIPYPLYVGVDADPTGWRFSTCRIGWHRWLDGIGAPLPPIVLIVGPKGSLLVGDGNHRLTTARELGLPILVQPKAQVPDEAFPELFGWRLRDDAADLPNLSDTELVTRMRAPNLAAAQEFRAELLACVARRIERTGEDFATAARGMFGAEGHGLACKFHRNEVDPQVIVGDLVRGLWGLPTTFTNVRHFVLAHTPPDDAVKAHYERTALPTLRAAHDTLACLIRALEGERR